MNIRIWNKRGKTIILIIVGILFLLVWAPWITDDYAINKVVERLGGPARAPKQEFTVILSQAMLITFEDQARWRIEHGLTDATEVPNYLDYIYADALEEVKTEAVSIIR